MEKTKDNVPVENPSLFNVYVIWSLDGPIMATLLQFEDTDQQRQAMQGWSVKTWIEQAFDAEFEDQPELQLGDQSYEVAAIFESSDIRFIY